MERRARPSMVPSSRAGAMSRTNARGRRTSTAKQTLSRQASVASRIGRAGAISPTESISSAATAGNKRKERDFDAHEGGSTNINVVVRCRGRNEREVRENSAVVLSTEGVKGKVVNLSMGPNALSNKAYDFDRVFSQAADQSMLFDDVVKPILGEMLSGYNCTIFAYGQTGTGKTYTMSGDLSDTLGLLADEAGIIPRVLHALFSKLEVDDTENCIKCSFIELYNEELRDLLSADEGAKLKIYDDTSRKGHASTVVQGMEERHITNAADGLRWLKEGSLRRQVAATKCNDLSSRSHTVFTITVHAKRPTESGEDYVCAGKLNLVDLAGSENIQRSGAENKRAAEAGLINKSLLTLGRVINALVDRSAHIPYRESKLTRLLQDSLGGRTKTCIIATVSPAKSNLEETISTLDYAFRAKNIRNKPQVNPLMHKKTLLREFCAEIEKLKSELIVTRQRNGVYLSNDAYEEMTVQNESRRILTEEQAAKISTLESNLRNKVQELFTFSSSFTGLRKEHEETKAQLDGTKEVLGQTELVLAATRKTLAEETHMRRAHQQTEEELTAIGGELIGTLRQTVGDVGVLLAKDKRKSDLQDLNRSTWGMSQGQVSSVTELVEGRVRDFRTGQEEHIAAISGRMETFVQAELQKLSATRALLDENLARFGGSKADLMEQNDRSKGDMDDVLEGIKVVRDSIKTRVGESLEAIAAAAERIAADILSELTTFHNQLHVSYSSLGKDFKLMFEDMARQISAQKNESERLRRQVEGAGEAIVQSNESASAQIQDVLDHERKQAAAERQQLLGQITALVETQAELQGSRLAGKAALIRRSLSESNHTFQGSVSRYSDGMDAWDSKGARLLEEISQSRDSLKEKLKDDWNAANGHSTSLQETAKAVHTEAVGVVDEQKRDLDVQMRDLDDFVTRARSENSEHHRRHAESMRVLSGTVEASFSSISDRFASTFDRVRDLGDEVEGDARELSSSLPLLEDDVCRPLGDLREDINSTTLREYEPTGDTPEKKAYRYPAELPRTAAPEALLAELQDAPTPSKPAPDVFKDLDLLRPADPPSRDTPQPRSTPDKSLREVDPNVAAATSPSTDEGPASDPSESIMSLAAIGEDAATPQLKRSTPSKPPMTRNAKRQAIAAMAREGAENVPPGALGHHSSGRRKSPRMK